MDVSYWHGFLYRSINIIIDIACLELAQMTALVALLGMPILMALSTH